MLKISNLCLSLNNKEVLKEINLFIREGKLTTIIGLNGSGKSSLINCINQTYKYNGNICLFHNKDYVNINEIKQTEIAKRISILPQVLSNPHIRVIDLVKMGRSPYRSIGKKLTESDYQIINFAIKEVGIENLSEKYVDELSGGERQKAFLALMLAQNTDMLVLDEPTTYLDLINEKEFLELIILLKKNYGKTILIVMHNLNNALNYSDDLIFLDKGKLICSGDKKDVINSHLIESIFKITIKEIDDKYVMI